MKLIGIDLDGTLLNSQQQISKINVQALKKITEDVFPFICSGRDIADIQNILRKFDLHFPAVGLNGAVGYEEERKLFEFSFTTDVVKKIESCIEEFPIKVYTNIGSYESMGYKESMIRIFKRIGQEFSVDQLNYELEYEKSIISVPFHKLSEIVSIRGIKIYKFFVFIPNTVIKEKIQSSLMKINQISVTESAPVNLEIVTHETSKGLAFNHLENIFQLKETQRFAIGDSLNDNSLFESADYGFAMGNSHPIIKAKADFVTSSNDNNGVAEALKTISEI